MGEAGGVWHVAREYEGIAETGGLKDVVAGLACALARRGIPATVVLPRYGFIDLDRLEAREMPLGFRLSLPVDAGSPEIRDEEVRVHEVRLDGVRVLLLDSECTRSKRAVYTWTEEDELQDPARRKGTGHWDAHPLNLLLQLGALEAALRLKESGEKPPEVFHCHDGHAAFLPAILKSVERYRLGLPGSRALVTIHNAGWGYHQEIYGLDFASRLTRLPRELLRQALSPACAPHECVDPLLLAPAFCPVNTVSEEYAREIMSGDFESLTGGLGGEYRRREFRLLGITNGIDPQRFDPRDPQRAGLPYGFDPAAGDLRGKEACRRTLLEALRSGRLHGQPLQGVRLYGSLDPADAPGGPVPGPSPLYTFIGRLAEQKGMDVLVDAASRLLSGRTPVRFLILGQGSPGIESRLVSLAGEVPARGRFLLLLGYQPAVARLIYASGDFFLIPSLFEPCGLTDFYAQLMGNLPVVHRVGGLVKVRDGFNGFSYREHSPTALAEAIRRSRQVYVSDPALLERMRRQAVEEIYARYTWDQVLERDYLPLYREFSEPLRPRGDR